MTGPQNDKIIIRHDNSEQNNRNCWPLVVIQEAVASERGRGWMPAPLKSRFQSQSDLYKHQKQSEKERERERENTHSHTHSKWQV